MKDADRGHLFQRGHAFYLRRVIQFQLLLLLSEVLLVELGDEFPANALTRFPSWRGDSQVLRTLLPRGLSRSFICIGDERHLRCSVLIVSSLGLIATLKFTIQIRRVIHTRSQHRVANLLNFVFIHSMLLTSCLCLQLATYLRDFLLERHLTAHSFCIAV